MTTYYGALAVARDNEIDESDGQDADGDLSHGVRAGDVLGGADGDQHGDTDHGSWSWASWHRSPGNWSWGSPQTARSWSGRRYENWSWGSQSEENDYWADRYWDSWESNLRPAGEGQGQGTSASPVSPGVGFDRCGNPPSGEVSSVGDQGQAQEPGDWERKADSGKGKVSTSYPPIFRAKPNESYQDWKRSVAFWIGGEGHQLPKHLVGPRLMVQLRDRAGQLVKHLNVEDVNGSDGMDKIFRVLEASPLVKQLDKHRVDQHRKKLMSLSRLPGESLESYITRGNIYRVQLEGMDKTLSMGERFYVGHLMDHAKLTKRDKAMIRTRAGDETEGNITTAMLDLASELEGESGFPIGVSEPNAAGANGEEFLVQRTALPLGQARRPFAKGALAADLQSTSGGGDEELLEEFEGEAGAESQEEEIPNELVELEKEAFAMQYKAKQKISELRKMRNYYKKVDPEERRRALAEKMRNTHCHACGELGHWAKECPKQKQTQQAFMVKHSGGQKMGTPSRKAPSGSMPSRLRADVASSGSQEWDLLVSLCSGQGNEASSEKRAAYMALPCTHAANGHEVLWNVQELSSSVILDLGCMKSVAGTKWMNQLLRKWKQNKRWYLVTPEKETFRFGDGNTLNSRFEVQIQATFAMHPVILVFSVVEGDCPPLLSKPACTSLGVIVDCANHMMSSRTLKVKNYGLRQTSSGHYIMNIDEFTSDIGIPDVPEDFRVPAGQEVHVWNPAEAVSKLKLEQQPRVVHGVILDRAEELQDMRRPESSQPGLPNDPLGGGGCKDSGIDEFAGLRSQSGEEAASEGSLGATADARSSGQGQGQGSAGRLGSGASRGDGGATSDSILRHVTDPCSHHPRGHPGGGQYGGEAPREGSSFSTEEKGTTSLDGLESRLSFVESLLVRGGGIQHGGLSEESHDHVPVEEAFVAAASKGGSDGDDPWSSLEEKSTLAGDAVGEGSGNALRSLRSPQAEVVLPGSPAVHVNPDDENLKQEIILGAADTTEAEESVHKISRGMTQKFKKGVCNGLENMALVAHAVKQPNTYTVLEIFAGSATLTMTAGRSTRWKAYEPVDHIFSVEHDLTKEANRKRMLEFIDRVEPDLVVVTPPCGPWCSWQNLRVDVAALNEERRQHLPFWKFARDVWDRQDAGGRLVLIENPSRSEAWDLRYMRERPTVHRVLVDQCMFGLHDPVSNLLYQKTTALDTNNFIFAGGLEGTRQRCNHQPHEHEQIRGMVKWEDEWVSRSEFAGRWTVEFSKFILKAAWHTLQGPNVQLQEPWRLHQSAQGPHWFAYVVEEIITPEEAIRKQMANMGMHGERFDFITFEGNARGLPRRCMSLWVTCPTSD